jgi:hypothetical protein
MQESADTDGLRWHPRCDIIANARQRSRNRARVLRHVMVVLSGHGAATIRGAPNGNKDHLSPASEYAPIVEVVRDLWLDWRCAHTPHLPETP